MKNFKAIEKQLQRDYLFQVASKGEILGLIAADAYMAIKRLFRSFGKRVDAIKHPSNAALPTVVLPHRWL